MTPKSLTCNRFTHNSSPFERLLRGWVNPSCNRKEATQGTQDSRSSYWPLPSERFRASRPHVSATPLRGGTTNRAERAKASESRRQPSASRTIRSRIVPRRRTTPRPPAILWLVVSLIPSVSAIDAQPGNISFTNAEFGGVFDYQSADVGVFRVPPAPIGSFEWALDAETLVVNWTAITVLERGKPDNLSEPGGYYEIKPVQYGEQRFDAIRATSRSSGPRSNIIAGGNVSLVGRPANGEIVRLQAQGDDGWIGGMDGKAAFAPLFRNLSISKRYFSVSADRSTIEMTGSFSLYVWAADVRVGAGGRLADFKSGSWVSWAPTGSQWAIWERTHQLLRLDVGNGRLELSTDARPAQWAASTFEAIGNMSATFADMQGSPPASLVRQAASHGGAILDGNLRLVATKHRQDVSRILGNVEDERQLSDALHPSESKLAPVVSDSAAARATQHQPILQASAWLAITGVVLAGSVWLVVRRKPSFEAVEWAVLAGHPRRAAFLAKRLVSSSPTNADAVFLYGSALLMRGQMERLLAVIEPLAVRIPRSQRSGIAFLLATAASAIQRHGATNRWAKEACADAELRQHVLRAGLLDAGKAVSQESSLAGYA